MGRAKQCTQYTCYPVHLLSILKIKIKHKINIDKNNFYTFNTLNARILRHNFHIYLLN
jgi:hypothetical protein